MNDKKFTRRSKHLDEIIRFLQTKLTTLYIAKHYLIVIWLIWLDQRRRKHKNLGGDGRGFARAPGLRKYKVARATPKKADERGGGGGLPPIFFRTISGHHLHYWVGVPSVHNNRPPGWQAKKKKKKPTRYLGGDYLPHLKFRGGHVPPASAAYGLDTIKLLWPHSHHLSWVASFAFLDLTINSTWSLFVYDNNDKMHSQVLHWAVRSHCSCRHQMFHRDHKSSRSTHSLCRHQQCSIHHSLQTRNLLQWTV